MHSAARPIRLTLPPARSSQYALLTASAKLAALEALALKSPRTVSDTEVIVVHDQLKWVHCQVFQAQFERLLKDVAKELYANLMEG
jgi:hypothetical protein